MWLFMNKCYLCSAMQIEVLKSKLHRVTITEANLDYIGSVTIDEDLMDAADLVENEKVDIYNYSNGERFHTYVLTGKRGSGIICLNGPASLKVKTGDEIIIASYAMIDYDKRKTHRPSVVFPAPKTNALK
jgi:aspartate 1-decarboxylase